MITIQNLTLNISVSAEPEDKFDMTTSARDELVNLLRIISQDKRFAEQTVVIPDSCDTMGFSKGEFALPSLLYFLADMLE